MAESYKTRKESFVSGLSGGSILEINEITAVAAVGCLSLVEHERMAHVSDRRRW